MVIVVPCLWCSSFTFSSYYLHLNFWIATFQVCMDIIGGVPTSYDKCLISWTLVWNFIWICMYDIILSKTHNWLSVCTALLHIMLCGEWIYLQDCCWFSDTYGLFNFLIPGTSFYSAIESSSWLVSVYEEMVLTVVCIPLLNLLFELPALGCKQQQ